MSGWPSECELCTQSADVFIDVFTVFDYYYNSGRVRRWHLTLCRWWIPCPLQPPVHQWCPDSDDNGAEQRPRCWSYNVDHGQDLHVHTLWSRIPAKRRFLYTTGIYSGAIWWCAQLKWPISCQLRCMQCCCYMLNDNTTPFWYLKLCVIWSILYIQAELWFPYVWSWSYSDTPGWTFLPHSSPVPYSNRESNPSVSDM